ncbi:MAG: DUF3489 domain-containing protein [Roseitalea porphyridii]|uniref:DUF3489 domain-containing protein n=1 Tax=Roseitalea porphyridii TaxID=1852022 RepID=UPI0032D94B38
MNTCTIENVGDSDTAAASHANSKSAVKRKPRDAIKSRSKGASKPTVKSKKDELVTLLSKPNGARISVIVERLGWQAHTVRAALSGLRKQALTW